MPYTPPAQRSPRHSAPASPDASRRPSASQQSRPSLPSSASYLSRHRRTPSAVSSPGDGVPPRPAGSADFGVGAGADRVTSSPSVRQSPPPVADACAMPPAAIISPPESSASSDDDEFPEVRGRRLEQLQLLQAAVKQIPQHRDSSPAPLKTDAGDLLVQPSHVVASPERMHHSFSTGSLAALGPARAHVRSATDSAVKSPQSSLSTSEDDSEDADGPRRKPPMVRKKSGELVRPALRGRRRPSSMPGTPTFSKAVHFDSHLEHVRHFLQVDRPLAVSAGSSPVDNYDSDAEYPFPAQPRPDSKPGAAGFEWEIQTTNFPAESPLRLARPVRLERFSLSADQKSLIGTVAVANLAFQKYVTCRFTLDYWKTTSEVAAEYSAEIRPASSRHSAKPAVSRDRFVFNIKLSDTANLESKTLYCCVRYNVNGQEHWDNNGGTNFQVDFRRKAVPAKKGPAGPAAAAVPRVNRRANPSTVPRPKSMPIMPTSDDFGRDVDHHARQYRFDQPIHEFLGETAPALRFKDKSSSLASDNLAARLSNPSGQAFANRYDFGASLSAAVQAAKDNMAKDRNDQPPDGLYMKPHRKPVPAAVQRALPRIAPVAPRPAPADAPIARVGSPQVNSPASSTIASSSYEEIVNKYCFYGTKQSSPQPRESHARSARFDGPGEDDSHHSSPSHSPQPTVIDHTYYTHTGTQGRVDPSRRHAHGEDSQQPSPSYFPQLKRQPAHADLFAAPAPPASAPPAQTVPAALPSPAEPDSAIFASARGRQRSNSSTAPVRASSPVVLPVGRRSPPAKVLVAQGVGSGGDFVPTAANTAAGYHHHAAAPLMHDRYPFSGPDTHPATAILG